MKGTLRCVPDPPFLLILYLDTRKSPTVGDGGVDGMTPIEKTQLLLICRFLPHPGLNSWTFPLACKSAKTTLPVTADRCQSPGDIQSFILSLLTEADGRSGAADALKSSARASPSQDSVASSSFLLPASQLEVLTPPPSECLLSLCFSRFSD